MVKIAYILLCHKDPDGVIRQARQLTAAGDFVAIHFDASAPASAFKKITGALEKNPSVVFAPKRIRCGWGEWSLVKATLLTLEHALQSFRKATHAYLISSDCMPTKSAEYIRDYLSARPRDFIESVDYFESNWIKTGWKEERLIYRHWFNERTQKRRFYGMFNAQRVLGLKRNIPRDIEMRIGSQWWCLRRKTCEDVLALTKTHRDVMQFFATTWIPDETFFQTVVRHLVPDNQIESRTLTFLMFTDYGMPVTFHNDHFDLLVSQDCLFARKISAEALNLKDRLGALYNEQGRNFEVSNEGRTLYGFIAGRGRVGRRASPRAWEAGARLGRDRELLILVCKKWHVARRLFERIAPHEDLPMLDYLFNEGPTKLPRLGGILSNLNKRHRHRRAVLRILFEHFEASRMVLCVDPSSIDVLTDVTRDNAVTRILEIECDFSDDDLKEHAIRSNIIDPKVPSDLLDRLIPALRADLKSESELLREARFAHHVTILESGQNAHNVDALSRFLSIDRERAQEMLSDGGLFAS